MILSVDGCFEDEGISVGITGQSTDVGEDAAFVTGASLLVDDGRTASMQDDTLLHYWQV